MRTLVLSDLHLSYGARAGVFAGTHALPALLAHLECGRPLRVVLNGDTFDFSALDERVESDPESAEQQIRAVANEPDNAPVFAALARVLDSGGELLLRAGEDDRELAAPAVQAGVRRLFPAPLASRLGFHADPGAAAIVIGGATIVLVYDLFGGAHADAARSLARRLTGPLRRQFGMEMVDLFKPDTFAGALAALAINPTAAKLLFSAERRGQVWPALAGRGSEDPGLAELATSFAAAELGPRERELLLAAFDPEAAIGCDPREAWLFDQARTGLLRAALRRLPPRRAGEAGPQGDLPDPEAWSAALALARGRSAQAVLAGHTHVPCFRAGEGLAYMNTGAWVWSFDPASDEQACARLLAAWQRSPRVDPRRRTPVLEARFAAGLVEPTPGGATLQQLQWTPGAGLVELAACELVG